MKPEELEVGKTYIGVTGKPRTIISLGKWYAWYKSPARIGYIERRGSILSFCRWAKEVQK